MAYRAFLGACISAVIFAACSSDETAPFVPPDGGDTGGTAGAGGAGSGGKGSGGKSSGGASSGGASSGGASSGGASSGGAAGGGGTATGGSANDAGDGAATGGATGTGGAGTGGTTGTGGAGTGGVGTGGADAGTACTALDACCATLSGQLHAACTTISGAGDQANCTAVTSFFCGPLDGGTGTGDAGGGCTALAGCCPETGARANQCNQVVNLGDDTICDQVATVFCN